MRISSSCQQRVTSPKSSPDAQAAPAPPQHIALPASRNALPACTVKQMGLLILASAAIQVCVLGSLALLLGEPRAFFAGASTAIAVPPSYPPPDPSPPWSAPSPAAGTASQHGAEDAQPTATDRDT